MGEGEKVKAEHNHECVHILRNQSNISFMETGSEKALQQVSLYKLLLSCWHFDINCKVSITETSGFAIIIKITVESTI